MSEVFIDCTKNCRMTKAMKTSAFCTGKSRILDGQIIFGCTQALAGQPKEMVALMACDLWDMGLEESCIKCPLECINNKNPNVSKTAEERKKLAKLIEQLKPNMILYGITPEQVEKITNTYSKKESSNSANEIGKEAIKIASFANETLKSILSGHRVDLAFFTLYAKRYSILTKNLKNKK